MIIDLTHTERRGSSRCVMCHDDVDTLSDHAHCECGAVYHDDCAPENCAIMGCGSVLVVDALTDYEEMIMSGEYCLTGQLSPDRVEALISRMVDRAKRSGSTEAHVIANEYLERRAALEAERQRLKTEIKESLESREELLEKWRKAEVALIEARAAQRYTSTKLFLLIAIISTLIAIAALVQKHYH